MTWARPHKRSIGTDTPSHEPGGGLALGQRRSAAHAVPPAGLHLAMTAGALRGRLPLPALRAEADRAVGRQGIATIEAVRRMRHRDSLGVRVGWAELGELLEVLRQRSIK